MSDFLLDVECLSAGYSRTTVLTGIAFKLSPGEIVALLGPNGSGKSTLLRTITKSLPPLAGSVRVAGESLDRLSYQDLSRRLAYVPQQESHVFAFTVREVVLMGRLPHSDSLFETTGDHRAAVRAMDDADCLHLADRPVTELSGGEAQRVLIARALAQETSLLLLDEPTSHLDVSHQLAIGDLLRGLAGKGYGILVAVHDLNWAATFAHRGLLLDRGHLVLDAAMPAILESSRLEETYGVAFQRVTDEVGNLHVFPSTPNAGKVQERR
ncbi:MAG: ABC transporter ATP-binding protein [Fimbriimonadaceae bacterium]|nr:ABC transporter ATP-binding protein [Fimbriimonadaceae bacterium]